MMGVDVFLIIGWRAANISIMGRAKETFMKVRKGFVVQGFNENHGWRQKLGNMTLHGLPEICI